MNKRDFVLSSVTTLTAGAALSTPAHAECAAGDRLAGRLARQPDLAVHNDAASWRAYVGQRFAGPMSAGGAELELRRVSSQASHSQGEQFSLTFAAASVDPALTSATHRLRHASGQQLSLYLQPSGVDADGAALYSADFSLMV